MELPRGELDVVHTSSSDAAALREYETRGCGADSALQLQDGALADKGLIDAVGIEKRLAGSERAVILVHGLEIDLRSDSKMFAEHNISAKSQEETAEFGCGLAERVAAIDDAASQGII